MLLASFGASAPKKGRFEARKGWSEAEPFCLTVACRSVLAGCPGQRRCRPVVIVRLVLRMLRGVAL